MQPTRLTQQPLALAPGLALSARQTAGETAPLSGKPVCMPPGRICVAVVSLLLIGGGAEHGAPDPPAVASGPDASASLRRSLSLDGTGWHLALDPTDEKVQKMAATGSKTHGPVSVPGAWAAQGFGEETAALRSQYFGVAIYTKTVTVPAALTAASRTLCE